MPDSAIELSEPKNQMVSTLNTSGSLFLLKQKTSTKFVQKHIREILLEVKPIRTYMGCPISIEYLQSSSHWIDSEFAHIVLQRIADLGIDLEQLGYESFIGNTSFKHAIGATLTQMIGLQATIKRAQYLVNFYNRSKTIHCTFLAPTHLKLEFNYRPGVRHSVLTTAQNKGMLKALWESLGYDEYDITIVTDKPSVDDNNGYTHYEIRWTEHSHWHLFKQGAKRRLFRWLSGSTYNWPQHTDYNHDQLLKAYIEEHEEKLGALRRLEQHFVATIDDNNKKIAAQEDELKKLKNRLVDKFERWIEANYQRPDVTIEKAVEEIGTTVSTLNRRLKDRGLPTSKKMLNDYRLDTAKVLLQRKKPSEVFVACGFKTASHFSQCYRIKFGSTPSVEHKGNEQEQPMDQVTD